MEIMGLYTAQKLFEIFLKKVLTSEGKGGNIYNVVALLRGDKIHR